MKKIIALLAPLIFCFVGLTLAQNVDDIIILEQDEGSGDVIISEGALGSDLYFGDSLLHFLRFDPDNNTFVFSDNIDFGGNEIVDFRLENLAIAPLCDAFSIGKAYHNTNDNYSYVCDGSSWNLIDNDKYSAPITLPFIYGMSPDGMIIDSTETVIVTGENFSPDTEFSFGPGVTVQSVNIINGSQAEISLSSGSSALDVPVTASYLNQEWTGNTLTFSVYESLTNEEVLEQFSENAAGVSEWIPNLYPIRFDDTYSGDHIIDGGNDMYDNGNYLNTDGQSVIQYTDGVLTTNETAWGTGGEYFTDVQNNIFFLSAKVGPEIDQFTITGNLGADGGGLSDTTVISYSGYRAYVKRVYGAGSDPSVNHMMIVPEDATVTHTFATSTDNDFDRLTGLSSLAALNDNSFYYLLFASQNGGYIDDAKMENILIYTIDNIIQ